VLGIRLRGRDWLAIAVVLAALVVLGLASRQAPDAREPGWAHWTVLGGAIGIALLGTVGVRRLGARAAVPAGLIAGLLFGTLAIAVRVLHGVDPLRLHALLADPALWAIVVTGIAGFYLHTVALQIGSVNGATAALVVGETVVPGIVGLVWFGDAARAGQGWLIGLGFALAVLGAVAVAAFGAASAAPTGDTMWPTEA
jgi:hypothetical protein